MRRRHDPFLKRLYRAGTRDALTLFFPDLAARLDWDHWQWIDKEIPILGKRRGTAVADLVGETRDREGRYLKVLVHPELQMTTDETMDWRVFEYNTGLLLQEGHPGTRVLTVVFYHCPGTEGIRERQFSLDFYEKSLHRITYWSVGLGELDAETYANADNPMGWALASWMRQQREGRVELRLRLVEKVLRSVRDIAYQGLLLDTLQTYYKLSMSEQRTEEQLLRTDRYREVEEMAQTVMERREARARREGRLEGEVSALQRAVVRVLRSRFPEISETLVARIEGLADPNRLEDLTARAVTVASPEEIEGLLSAP